MNDYTRRAYSEVNSILNSLGDYYKNKLPTWLVAFFERERDKTYVPQIDIVKPVKEQGFTRETITIISGLNLQYWCDDQEKKNQLKEIYRRNGVLYHSELLFEWTK